MKAELEELRMIEGELIRTADYLSDFISNPGCMRVLEEGASLIRKAADKVHCARGSETATAEGIRE